MICVQGSLFNSALPFSSNVSEEKKHIWTTSDLSSLKGKNPKAASTAGLCYKAGQLTGKSCLAQRTWESCAGRNALCCLPGGNWPGERSSGSPAALVRLTEVNRSHSPLVLYTAHSCFSSHRRSQLFPNKRCLDWLNCPFHWWQQLIPELKPNTFCETGL